MLHLILNNHGVIITSTTQFMSRKQFERLDSSITQINGESIKVTDSLACKQALGKRDRNEGACNRSTDAVNP